MLTPEQVTLIRTAGLSDIHFSKLYGVTPQNIRLARIGETFRHVATPPDIRPRSAGRTRRHEAHVVTPSPNLISQALASWRRPSISEHP